MKLSECKKLYLEAKEAYYLGNPIMSDATFDRLENWISSKDPDWDPLKKTGVKIGKKVEVELPFFMPSLDKRYENIDEWFTKNPRYRWAYMAKLDGCSVLLEYVKGKPNRLITRGDGERGKDISYFLPYLSIPKKIKHKNPICFRCEAILTKEDYAKKWVSEFDNPRNLVSGIFNRQDAHPALKDVHLVVLGVFGLPQYKGLQAAFKAGFETVYCKLDAPREQVKHFDLIRCGKYEADGVVICNPDFIYKYDSAEKPKRDIIAYHIVEKSAQQIDCVGLSLCLKSALAEITEHFSARTQRFVFDGNTTFGLTLKAPHTLRTIIKGDSKHLLIGAASILAKVAKDTQMHELHALYPHYGFDTNKGYGTKAHTQAILRYGYTPFHRRSFALARSFEF